MLALLILGCAKTILSPAEYVKWVEEEGNGLTEEKKIGDLVFELQYRPLDYVVMMDTKNMNISKDSLEQRKQQMSGLQHFVLRMRVEGFNDDVLKYNLTNPADYESRVKYFSFQMQNDLKLIDGKDTLYCGVYSYERAFGITPYTTFVLGFPVKEKNQASVGDKTLLFDDKILGAGPLRITISEKNIENIPQLKTVN